MSNSLFCDQVSWYVVHTRPRQELRALEQLQNQHYTCFLPTLLVDKIRDRKIETCEEPLFSRYLFIRLNLNTSNWASIRSTRGVSSLLAFGGRYATLDDSWIEALKNVPSLMHQALFTPGECIAIESGPFAGLEGIYQAPDGETRALILVEMMSRPQKLHLPVEVLRKTAGAA